MVSVLQPLLLRQGPRTMMAARKPFSSTAVSSRTVLARTSTFGDASPRNPLLQTESQARSQVVAFHASAIRPILPALPQRIVGTVNEAAPVPHASPSHGSYHWTFERLLSVGLIPLTIAPFAAGSLNPIMDATLCFAILTHSHIGFESVIIDYIPTRRLPKTRALFWWGLRGATVAVGVGLYEFETNDVGLTEAIKKVWTA